MESVLASVVLNAEISQVSWWDPFLKRWEGPCAFGLETRHRPNCRWCCFEENMRICNHSTVFFFFLSFFNVPLVPLTLFLPWGLDFMDCSFSLCLNFEEHNSYDWQGSKSWNYFGANVCKMPYERTVVHLVFYFCTVHVVTFTLLKTNSCTYFKTHFHIHIY
jgi:hypothetical protein